MSAPPKEMMRCPRCGGDGSWWEEVENIAFVYSYLKVCPVCLGDGRVDVMAFSPRNQELTGDKVP